MGSEKPHFLSQPVVKNVFMFRNGDPYFEARRIVINEKRVSNFETLLREVTGGIQARFGAVRNIYTPRGGHRVEGLESLQSGEQYVAAGKERFKKLDYLDIGTRKRRMMQAQPLQLKPLPPNRIIVSARFLKPIKDPSTIFVVANGDTLNPAIRLLIHHRIMGQFDKILELITEKMGLRVLGGVRSLYTYDGHQVTDGNKLECGQLYVAVGRERFKKLPYSDILFTRPKGTRRMKGMKAYSLPPIYRFSKQSASSKSPVQSSDSGDGESKDSPPNHSGSSSSSKEHLSVVREGSQARLLSLRTMESGQSITAGTDNDDPEPKADDGNTDEASQDQEAEENSEVDDEQKATTENDEMTDGKVETPEDSSEENISANKEDETENQETNVETSEEMKEAEEQHDDIEKGATAENEQDVKEEVKVEVMEESKDEVNSEEQDSNSCSDKTEGNKDEEDRPNASSETETEQDNEKDEDKQEIKDSGCREESSNDSINDVESGEEQKEAENCNSPQKTQSEDESKESDSGRSSSCKQQGDEETNKEATKETEKEEDVVKTDEEATKEPEKEDEVKTDEEATKEPEKEEEVKTDEEATKEPEKEDGVKTDEEATKEPEKEEEEESKESGEVKGDSEELGSGAELENKNSDS
ncbi:doublecortin domain-containing protein 2 [Nematolebias whitei]|uniref:doublecortin domain-containing protein 2 n=1 Tax=Nematolebias whitei TaxID=451745 RepID=UPI00189ADE25|nr:doublecortin domain-containing protein 2 [Nematolebias whitei]